MHACVCVHMYVRASCHVCSCAYYCLSTVFHVFCVSLQICYVETSAKNRSNVDKSFHDLIRVIRYVCTFNRTSENSYTNS